jgi:hypothetical protein
MEKGFIEDTKTNNKYSIKWVQYSLFLTFSMNSDFCLHLIEYNSIQKSSGPKL